MAKRTGSALLTPETVKKIQPFLITDKQFADLLQVSVRTIHARAASDPTFPVSVRVGRSRRWVLEEAEAWCRSRAPRDKPPRRCTVSQAS